MDKTLLAGWAASLGLVFLIGVAVGGMWVARHIPEILERAGLQQPARRQGGAE